MRRFPIHSAATLPGFVHPRLNPQVLRADPGLRGGRAPLVRANRAGWWLARLCRGLLLAAGLGAAAVAALAAHVWLSVLPQAVFPPPPAGGGSVTVAAADGMLLARIGDLPGQGVTADALPPALVSAVLAIEDRRFFAHPGIDPVGTIRALVRNLSAGALVQGGSSLTQQTVKLAFLSPERTVRRKVQEALLALAVEIRYGKAEILAEYLNRAYFGGGAHGADRAARLYFGKPAAALGLAEAAVLAAALKAPSRYNLRSDRPGTLARARLVLDAMVQTGAITPAQAAGAMADLATLQALPRPPRGGYFADWIAEQVRGMPETWGRQVTVRTTLDPTLQSLAEAELARLLQSAAADQVGQGAIVLMTPTGEVRAMVGGRDYAASQFNRVVDARRQPGSTFKTFVYLTALEQGYTPDTPLLDAPVTLGGWSPDNLGDSYHGMVPLRQAFARSLNTPAVRLGHGLGIRTVAQTARRLGIMSPLREDATLTLGTSEVSPLELAGATATIASGGVLADVHGILEVRDADGTLLYQHAQQGDRVIRPDTAAALTELMETVVVEGTGRAARPGVPAAGKTGTSQGHRDAWFTGFTGHLVGTVWLGNDDGRPMKGVTGSGHPAHLWRSIMQQAHKHLPVLPLVGTTTPLVADGPDQARAAEVEAFLQWMTGR